MTLRECPFSPKASLAGPSILPTTTLEQWLVFTEHLLGAGCCADYIHVFSSSILTLPPVGMVTVSMLWVRFRQGKGLAQGHTAHNSQSSAIQNSRSQPPT